MSSYCAGLASRAQRDRAGRPAPGRRLSRPDHDHIRRAVEFLLRVRNEMHFTAGKSSDVLDRAEQMRLAQVYGSKARRAFCRSNNSCRNISA